MSLATACAMRMMSSAEPRPAAEFPIGPAKSTIDAATKMFLAVTPGAPLGAERHPAFTGPAVPALVPVAAPPPALASPVEVRARPAEVAAPAEEAWPPPVLAPFTAPAGAPVVASPAADGSEPAAPEVAPPAPLAL